MLGHHCVADFIESKVIYSFDVTCSIDTDRYIISMNAAVLEALDWLIQHNTLYEDLNDGTTTWRNEAAIADYTNNPTYTVEQRTKQIDHDDALTSPPPEGVDPQHIELGRSQPGLDDNAHNKPSLTPSFDVCDGDYIDLNPANHHTCPYSTTGQCQSPETCLCRQTYKAVPDGKTQTHFARWATHAPKVTHPTPTSSNIHVSTKHVKPHIVHCMLLETW